jgi:hypothetical protein
MSEAQTPGQGEGAPPRAGVVTRVGRIALPVLLAAMILAGAFLAGHRYRAVFAEFSFNSDALYGVELCQDLLGRGYERSSWHIPYAPQFFPDLVLLLPCVALLRDLVHVFLAYWLLYHVLSLTILTCLFRHAGLGLRQAFVLAASGELFLLAALLTPACTGWLPVVCVPACHTGALLAGLLLWLMVVRTLHRPARWWEAGLFVLVGGLTVFSDRLALAQFIGPMALAVLGLALFRVVPWRKAAETWVLAGAAYGCSAAILAGLARCDVVLLPLKSIANPANIGAALEAFVQNLPTYVRGQHLVIATFCALLLVGSAAGLAQLLRARRARLAAGTAAGVAATETRPGAAALPVAAVCACLCNLAAIVLSGVGTYPGTPRYLLAALFLPFLFLGLCLRLLPGRPLALLARAFPLAVVIFAASELGRRQGVPPLAWEDLRQPYPELARTLDRLAREGKVCRGIATYWHARMLQYLSREHVPVMVVHPHGEPWLHLQNPNTYLAPGRGRLEVPRYNFIVFDPNHPAHPMKAEELCSRFGSPREKVRAGGCEVWLYDGLIDTAFTQFLRSVLAQRCRAQLPCRGPTTPRRLARPTTNFAPTKAGGRVSLKPEGKVTVSFAEPVRGALLDVGAPFDAHFRVTFRRGQEILGEAYVPRASFPSASGGYTVGVGNQSRLVTIPPAARERGWTEATVRAAGGPGTFALGHFLVYEGDGRRVSARQMGPGDCWRFEAEHQPGGHRGPDAIVADPLASEGKARFAPPGFCGPVVHGPYRPLEPGRYRAEFHVRAEVGDEQGPVGEVDVVSEHGKRGHARRQLVRSDFAGKAGYQKVVLQFESEVDVNACELRVFSSGKVPLYADRVELVCER